MYMDGRVKRYDYVFFLIIFFWRSGLDMLSQNLEGGSNYASDMLILVYLRVHP